MFIFLLQSILVLIWVNLLVLAFVLVGLDLPLFV